MTVLSTTQARAAWGPVCHPPMVLFAPLAGLGAVHLSIDARTVEANRALDQCFRAHGVTMRPGVCGSYNCRLITGGSGYSLHAYAIADDLNWDTNPYSTTKYVTDFPAELVQDIRAIRTLGGAQVWVSGADFDNNGVLGDHGPFDAMHFQIACTPAQLAAGIDWSTVAGANPVPIPVFQEDLMAVLTEVERRMLQLAEAGNLVDQWYVLYTPTKRDSDTPGKIYWRAQVLSVLEGHDPTSLDKIEFTFAALVANEAGVQPASAPGKPDSEHA